jgi:hypothetical protein
MNDYQTEPSCALAIASKCPKCGQEECSCSMSAEILSLVKCAKHDLLKDKMKKLLEVKIGKKLDKVAEVAVEAVIAKMEHKIAQKLACEHYEDNLMSAWEA